MCHLWSIQLHSQRRGAAFVAQCSRALIDSMAVDMMQLEVDVPTTAAAVESSAAARRRRILPRSHRSPTGVRQESASMSSPLECLRPAPILFEGTIAAHLEA